MPETKTKPKAAKSSHIGNVGDQSALAIYDDIKAHIDEVLPEVISVVSRTNKKASFNLRVDLGYRKEGKEKRLFFATEGKFHKPTPTLQHEAVITDQGQLCFIGPGFEVKTTSFDNGGEPEE